MRFNWILGRRSRRDTHHSGAWRKALSLLVGSALVCTMVATGANPAAADWAKAGSGQHLNEIYWIDWSPIAGTATSTYQQKHWSAWTAKYPTHDILAVDETAGAAPKQFTFSPYPDLVYTATMSDWAAKRAEPFNQGALDTGLPGGTSPLMATNLGNFAGTGFGVNYRQAGLSNLLVMDQTNWKFNIKLSATWKGEPVGVSAVVADSETSRVNATSDPKRPGEYGQATTNGSDWSDIEDLRKTPGATWDSGDDLVDSAKPGGFGTKTYGSIRSEHATPLGVSSSAGDDPLTLNMTLNAPFGEHGGTMVMAVGVVVPKDTSDAPASYGRADHLASNYVSGTGTPNTDAAMAYNPSVKIGAGITADTTSPDSWDADANDDGVTFGVPTGAKTTKHVYVGATAVTATMKATDQSGAPAANTAASGWIDVNANGTFDDSEKISGMTDAAGVFTGTVNVPGGVTDAMLGGIGSRFRVTEGRFATDIASPTTTAYNGEVEDYLIPVIKTDAQADTAEALPGVAKAVDVLANDIPAPGVKYLPDTVKLSTKDLPAGSTLSPDGKKLTVPGQGAYQVESDGRVTFTSLPSFTGVATPVTYTVETEDGFPVSATLTVTVDAAAPVAKDETKTLAAGAGATFDVVALSAPGTTGSALDPKSVKLEGVDGSEVTRFKVSGEGVWTVDPENGKVTFAPDPGFVEDPSPVRYSIADTRGVRSALATLDITPLAIHDVAAAGAQGSPVTVATKLDAGLDPKTVKFPASGQPGGATPAADGKSIRVADQGTWTVGDDGTITFTPDAGFQGNPDPIRYTATDAAGNTTPPATVTVSYPDVVDLAGSGDTGKPVTVPLTGARNVVPGSVVFPSAGQPDGATPAADGKSVTVAGQGEWTISGEGAITFTPLAGFTGTPTPVSYTGADAAGNAAEPAKVAVTYPGAEDITGRGPQGRPVTVPAKLTGGALPDKVGLLTSTGDAVKWMEVSGEGAWTVGDDGSITFSPAPNFKGDPTPVTYRSETPDGKRTLPATVTILYPNVIELSGSGDEGKPVTVPLTGTRNVVPETATFPAADQPTGATVSADGKSLTVPDQGVWTIGSDGDITFTPAAGFSGSPTPVNFTAADSAGNLAEPSKVFVTYPGAADVAGRGEQGKPVTVPVKLDGGALPDKVMILTPSGDPVKRLEVPGEGVWSVGSDGAITFTPEAGFQGVPTPVKYRSETPDGKVTLPATVTVSYPDVSDVSGNGKIGEPVTLHPALNPNTVSLKLLTPAGDPVTELVVPGEGTWTLGSDLSIIFTPETGFTKNPTPVHFIGLDSDGNISESAVATVTYDPVPIGTEDLPRTGISGLSPLLGLAGLAILLGGFFLFIAYRRRLS